jgi:hypothetical protein
MFKTTSGQNKQCLLAACSTTHSAREAFAQSQGTSTTVQEEPALFPEKSYFST